MHTKRWIKRALALTLTLFALSSAAAEALSIFAPSYPVTEDGAYHTLEEVAVYLDAYGRLPQNFLSKREAEGLGWSSRQGNLDEVAPGCSIGGDPFGNYEGGLPDAEGRRWTECDIDFSGGYRGGKRLIFSNDGLMYYTVDHYSTFVQVTVTRESGAVGAEIKVKKSGKYTSCDEVAAYLHRYGRLPGNYLTKSEAKKLGWSRQKDNLEAVAPGGAIGGDAFGNREGLLPDADGRAWHECDVNIQDGKRGRERLVYSSDGLIYYTTDNYQSFTRLY